MVVVSRKTLESVVVGAPNPLERLLKVTVLQIGDGDVQLGFEVDPDTLVESLDVRERNSACAQPAQPEFPASRHNGVPVDTE
jgi:sRNA-binding carbon storage regulator CsrA